jgi:hypothetical protein
MGFDVDATAFDGLVHELLTHGDRTETIVPKMLKAGAAVLIDAQKVELRRVGSSGALANSLVEGKISKTRDGAGMRINVNIAGNQPHGHPRKGKRGPVSNAQVGFMLEYGSSKQAGRPWLSAANKKAESAVNDAMRKVWEDSQQ